MNGGRLPPWNQIIVAPETMPNQYANMMSKASPSSIY